MDLCIKTYWMKFDVFPKVYVSILVLMDLCIKTKIFTGLIKRDASFNPCFNGSMYKNKIRKALPEDTGEVSILVLMDLCIKTDIDEKEQIIVPMFQSLF